MERKEYKKSGNSSMVEYCVANAKVEGSNPFFRFILILKRCKDIYIIYCPIQSVFDFFCFKNGFFFFKYNKEIQKKGYSKQNRKLSNTIIPSSLSLFFKWWKGIVAIVVLLRSKTKAFKQQYINHFWKDNKKRLGYQRQIII